MYEFLREMMAEAGAELQSRQGKGLQIEVKADSSLVTEADLASERVLIERIQQVYPEDKILSEEAGLSSVDRTPGTYIWVIDPLDGTTNYANGYPFYCVSVGRGRFRLDGSIEMVSGAVLDPSRDRFYYAGLGEGAFVDGRPLRVAPARDFPRCFLVTGFYYLRGAGLDVEIERFARVAQQCQSIRRDGAAALDLAMVAEGIYDAFWETGLKPWDVAAGTLLVSEARGTVRNYEEKSEKPYDIEGIGVIAGSQTATATIAGLL